MTKEDAYLTTGIALFVALIIWIVASLRKRLMGWRTRIYAFTFEVENRETGVIEKTKRLNIPIGRSYHTIHAQPKRSKPLEVRGVDVRFRRPWYKDCWTVKQRRKTVSKSMINPLDGTVSFDPGSGDSYILTRMEDGKPVPGRYVMRVNPTHYGDVLPKEDPDCIYLECDYFDPQLPKTIIIGVAVEAYRVWEGVLSLEIYPTSGQSRKRGRLKAEVDRV